MVCYVVTLYPVIYLAVIYPVFVGMLIIVMCYGKQTVAKSSCGEALNDQTKIFCTSCR